MTNGDDLASELLHVMEQMVDRPCRACPICRGNSRVRENRALENYARLAAPVSYTIEDLQTGTWRITGDPSLSLRSR
jgi:hypothetical protein